MIDLNKLSLRKEIFGKPFFLELNSSWKKNAWKTYHIKWFYGCNLSLLEKRINFSSNQAWKKERIFPNQIYISDSDLVWWIQLIFI